MVLHERQFTNRCVGGIHSVSWWCLYPSYWLLNTFLSLFNRSSDEIAAQEEDPCYQRYVILSFTIPILFVLFLVSAPFALIGLLIWIPVNHARRPYAYSYQPSPVSTSLVSVEATQLMDIPMLSIASANVLLLPEAISRINNMSNTQQRACRVGKRVVSSQCSSLSESQTSIVEYELNHMDIKPNISEELQSSVLSHVSATFPSSLDFLCLQEVFDRRAGQSLASILHQHFPYVVYDVGRYTWSNNYFVLNSGLLFASRYPILDVDYECYEHCSNEDSLAAKGLLMVKVRVGSVMDDGVRKEVVGYIANTHLQAERGEHEVRNCQLTDAHDWLELFKSTTSRPDEKVAFDFLCGDFNFDNMSQDSQTHWNHKLMLMFKDPCSVGPGLDHDWTVGTELNQMTMHSKFMKTPELMKSVLDDSTRRAKYVESSHHDGKTRNDGKRRIDLILYNLNCPVIVEEYSFVSNLASLTDHIPVAMTFRPDIA